VVKTAQLFVQGFVLFGFFKGGGFMTARQNLGFFFSTFWFLLNVLFSPTDYFFVLGVLFVVFTRVGVV